MAQDTSKKNMIIAQGLSLFSNAEESVFTEESIWRSIVYQCIISKVSLGKIWPLLHFKEYDGIKKGRPILDDETYKEILKWTSCSNRDLLMPDEQCEQRMTELLIMLLETESWYYEKKESDATCKVISINLKGDKLRLCYGAYAENDEGFLVDYLPVQTPAEPKISYTLFEELFYIKNEKMKQLFFRQLGIDTREIIYNPLRKFSVGCNKELSFLDLYIMDYELFTKIKNGDFDIVFAPEFMNFFEKNKPYQKNVPFNIKQKKMIDAWERFNNSRRNRTIRELNEKLIKDNIEQSLLRATLSKEIRWLEVLDVHSQTTINRQYVCDFYNLKWDFTVSGYKKENKWRANFELKWKNRYDDMSSFGGACHAELYKAIRDSVIRKEKPIVNQYIKKREPGERKREIEIGSSDFLVRTNLFRCYHKEHLVEEILGVVKVVTPKGDSVTREVSCAYCPECHCFYMLQSQFAKLSEGGIVLCQLIEKDEYYGSGKLGDFNAASESLLMRNGYNVKANNGLTDIQRKVILQNIMDNNILSPHRISSYLDMFIAQKKNMPQYKEAIAKWEKDKQFVLAYQNGQKRAVEVQTIKK